MDIYRELYRKMEEAGILDVIEEEWIKLEAPEMMDLNVESFPEGKNLYKVSIAHFYEENGDLVPDPEVVLLVNTDEKTAVPIFIQNNIVYQRATDPLLRMELAVFTRQWLDNIINMKYTRRSPNRIKP